MSVPSRPAFDDASIWVRKEGRQIAISTGEVDTSDRGEDDTGEVPPDPDDAPESPGGTRQKITGFSERSRRLLRRWVHAIHRDAQCLFMTLTYHETDPHPREAKTHLDTFCKRMMRQWPEAAVVWKMEPQERGTVHFHLLVYNVPFIPAQQISAVWHDITPESSPQHRKAGVDIERGVHQNDGKLAAYLAKYMDKVVSADWEDPGRFWGIRNREALPLARWEKLCTLTRAKAQQIIYDLLDRWGVDLPEHTRIPSLTIDTRGDPANYISQLP
jgi:hypothetical protein